MKIKEVFDQKYASRQPQHSNSTCVCVCVSEGARVCVCIHVRMYRKSRDQNKSWMDVLTVK